MVSSHDRAPACDSVRAMPTFRVWVLILFAALLPLRGVAAASLLCAPAPVHAMPHDAHGTHGGHHAHATAGEAGDPAPAAGALEPTQKCTLCCAVGAATPLIVNATALPAPIALARLVYPSLQSPAPRFESAGPERPPRAG